MIYCIIINVNIDTKFYKIKSLNIHHSFALLEHKVSQFKQLIDLTHYSSPGHGPVSGQATQSLKFNQ